MTDTDSPISDAMVEAAALHMSSVARIYYGPQIDAPHMARKFAHAALESAYPAIRQQVAEQIAAAIEKAREQSEVGYWDHGMRDAAEVAREIGTKG